MSDKLAKELGFKSDDSSDYGTIFNICDRTSVKCIRESAKYNISILVRDENRKKYIIEKAASMGEDIPPVYSVADMKNKNPSFVRPKKVIIENLTDIAGDALREYLNCIVPIVFMRK